MKGIPNNTNTLTKLLAHIQRLKIAKCNNLMALKISKLNRGDKFYNNDHESYSYIICECRHVTDATIRRPKILAYL